VTPLAIQFNLDEYTNWWNSPQAALYFWLGFLVLMVLVGAGIVFLLRARAPK
jgi:hypothetical protein